MARYGATGLFLMMAMLVVRDYGLQLRSVLAALAALSGAGYGICTYLFLPQEAVPLQFLFLPFCIMGPVLVWLFSLSLFQDDFKLGPLHWAGTLLYFGLNQLFFSVLYDTSGMARDTVFVIYSILRFGLIVHMLFVAWQGRDDDLLCERRRFRSFYIVAVGVTISTIFVRETFLLQGSVPDIMSSFFHSVLFFLLAVFVFWHTTKANTDILLNTRAPGAMAKAVIPAAPEGNDPADQIDLDEIQRLMSAENYYLKPGLTVAGLAEAAKVPEHRLRRLINSHLGYRNFSAFLNDFRIEAAKQSLADTDKRHVPVLTIAMDLGYGSLGPFNRAFKERTGQTPTEYRRASLGG
ncbi:MAG: helix-turn-helix transcriptional regulator [Alphaproteobacteria bacterium]|nr:helix-turn-helix transcriptional regulator [Alphaproteobacteria bacterium]